MASARRLAATAFQSAWLSELIVAARIPMRAAASSWFRIKDSSGEIRMAGPIPDSRSKVAAMKYTKLLPQPVF
jgi:hypothetical protein